jgi:hypothetical protein
MAAPINSPGITVNTNRINPKDVLWGSGRTPPVLDEVAVLTEFTWVIFGHVNIRLLKRGRIRDSTIVLEYSKKCRCGLLGTEFLAWINPRFLIKI